MSISSQPAHHTPTTVRGDSTSVASTASRPTEKRQFVAAALDMSWQLAVVVLVPIFAGVQLDKHFGTEPSWMIAGFIVAAVGFGTVVWKAFSAFNQPITQADIDHAKQLRDQEGDDD